MSKNSKSGIVYLFLYALLGGVVYWGLTRYGPIGSLFERFGDRGWIPMFLIPAVIGISFGLILSHSVLLSFPEFRNGRNTFYLLATIGGFFFGILNPLGIFHYLGVLILVVVFGLLGKTWEMKLRIIVSMLGGNLFGFIAGDLPAGGLFKINLAVWTFLEGYFTNIGLLLGFQNKIKFIWCGAFLGFILMNILTPFPSGGYAEVLIGIGTGAGIGYLLDRKFRSKT